jgi:hypothetical protein
MSTKKLIFLAFIATFALSSCSKKSTPNPTTKAPVVYVIGNIRALAGYSVAAYWKNGVLIALTDTTNEFMTSYVTGIAVKDTDVYMSGTINSQAVYWKNGKVVNVGGPGSIGNGIAVNGNDVYVAGEDINNSPVYWKNGTEVSLNGVAGEFADGIAISGNDVYVAGNDPYDGFIFYWKDGVLSPVISSPSSYNTYYLNSSQDGWVNIAVSGTDVYITGATPGFLTATYWKNGMPVYQLDHPTETSILNGIAINGTDIYVAGFYNDGAAYWKNGTLNMLPGKLWAEASAIAVNGTDVYIAGFFNGTYAGSPVYWKNGTLYTLPGNVVNTTGIALVQY